MTLTLGVAAVVAPLSVGTEPVLVPVAFMLGLLLLLLALMRRRKLDRASGLALVMVYALYLVLTLQA